MTAAELLQSITDSALQTGITSKAGHNGPYNDPETPVRNAGHWLITFNKLFSLTGQKKYYSAAEENLHIILNQKYRPYNKSFHHRTKNGKDTTNGLIGQAWTIESLCFAAELFARPDLMKIAENTFRLHPFNKKSGLWHKVDLNGNDLGVDPAFNHQLWFAMVGALTKSEKILADVQRFLDQISRNLKTYPNGLIFHLLKTPATPKEALQRLVNRHSKFFRIFKGDQWYQKVKSNHPRALVLKSAGYHAFNMFAFYRLYEYLPTHPFWKSGLFQSTLLYMLTQEYKNQIYQDKTYGFPYNPPGFEIPPVLDRFKKYLPHEQNYKQIAENWFYEQLKITLDKKNMQLSINTNDPLTLSARIYEIALWPDNLLESLKTELP